MQLRPFYFQAKGKYFQASWNAYTLSHIPAFRLQMEPVTAATFPLVCWSLGTVCYSRGRIWSWSDLQAVLEGQAWHWWSHLSPVCGWPGDSLSLRYQSAHLQEGKSCQEDHIGTVISNGTASCPCGFKSLPFSLTQEWKSAARETQHSFLQQSH